MAMTLIKMQTLNNSSSEFETTDALLLFWGLKWNKLRNIQYIKNSASEMSVWYGKKLTVQRDDCKLTLAKRQLVVPDHCIKTTFCIQFNMQNIIFIIAIWQDYKFRVCLYAASNLTSNVVSLATTPDKNVETIPSIF